MPFGQPGGQDTIGNTHTVVGLISGSGDHAKVVQHWRIRTESEVTSDELALTIDGLIGDDSEHLTGAAGLSTVPSVLHEVRLMLEQYWPSVPHVLIEPGVRTGIPLLVDNPKEVGADRIVNCLAAFHRYHSAAIVVDYSTAGAIGNDFAGPENGDRGTRSRGWSPSPLGTVDPASLRQVDGAGRAAARVARVARADRDL